MGQARRRNSLSCVSTTLGTKTQRRSSLSTSTHPLSRISSLQHHEQDKKRLACEKFMLEFDKRPSLDRSGPIDNTSPYNSGVQPDKKKAAAIEKFMIDFDVMRKKQPATNRRASIGGYVTSTIGDGCGGLLYSSERTSYEQRRSSLSTSTHSLPQVCSGSPQPDKKTAAAIEKFMIDFDTKPKKESAMRRRSSIGGCFANNSSGDDCGVVEPSAHRWKRRRRSSLSRTTLTSQASITLHQNNNKKAPVRRRSSMGTCCDNYYNSVGENSFVSCKTDKNDPFIDGLTFFSGRREQSIREMYDKPFDMTLNSLERTSKMIQI